MVCRNCKKIIPDESELCPECGAKTGKGSARTFSPEPKPATPKRTKSRKGMLIAVIAMVMAIVIGATAIFVTSRVNKAKKYEEKLEELLDTNDYESIIEEYRKAINEGMDNDFIDEEVKDVYERWIEEKLKDKDFSFKELFDIAMKMAEDFPEEREEVQKMMGEIMEEYQKRSEEHDGQDIFIVGGDDFPFPEGFDDLYDLFDEFGFKDFDDEDTYSEFMENFNNIIKKQLQ
jgi:uncharacterized membrane protein YvbJ